MLLSVESIFYTREWIKSESNWENDEVAERWEVMKDLRQGVNQFITKLDPKHKINQPIEAYLSITLPQGEVYDVLKVC